MERSMTVMKNLMNGASILSGIVSVEYPLYIPNCIRWNCCAEIHQAYGGYHDLRHLCQKIGLTKHPHSPVIEVQDDLPGS